jgi:hypothetical protein
MDPAQSLQSMPYRLSGKVDARTLDFGAFRGDSQVPNVLSTFAYFDVPLSHMVVLRSDVNIRLYLKARFEGVVALAAAGNEVVNLGAINQGFILTGRQNAAFPTVAHSDLVAFVSEDAGVTWLAAAINAVNVAAGTITVQRTANTNRVKVYFLPSRGNLEIRAFRPAGSDGISAKLFGQPFRAIAESDQTNVRSVIKLDLGEDKPLPSQFRLALQTDSPSTIAWVAEAQHEIAILVRDAPIEILNLQELNVAAERQLRGGNF